MMLTKEQIDYLFTFCRKHLVWYYDVQVELVDHLANAVEAEMKNNSPLSFEKAVEKVHEGFGIRGFAPLVAEKQKAAERHSHRLFLKLFREQFKWPKVLLFLLLGVVFYTLFSKEIFQPAIIFFAGIILAYTLFFISLFRLRFEVKKTSKKFLIVNFSWIGVIFFFPVYGINIYQIFFQGRLIQLVNEHSVFLFASIFLSIFIVAAIAFSQTFMAIGNKLHKDYPEVFSISQ
jgi:hypothetical protein